MMITHRFLLACGILQAAGITLAGTAGDPTQPPAKWASAQVMGGPSAPAWRQQPMETQVILYSPDRKIVVIDGQLVRMGETYNGERLVAMKPNEVQWKRADRAAADARPPIFKKSVRNEDKQ